MPVSGWLLPGPSRVKELTMLFLILEIRFYARQQVLL